MSAELERGIKLYNLKQYKKALIEFKALEDKENLNIEVMYYIGLCLTQLGSYDDALLYLEQVVQSEFSFLHIFQSRMVLGYIYSITGRYQLAEYEFKRLINSGFESSQIYAAMGYVLYSQRKVKDAVTYLEKSLEMDPENANAANSLGYILVEEDIDVNRALKLCRKAVKKKSKNAAYLDSLGWIYYKKGNVSKAHSYLRQALAISPGNKQIVKHMKTVLSKKD
ncbi:MAG: tetratricopeptide repeat protein [Spirochaetales bacterium]|nr:tetratricopeptide repeat protein [Spirochaetales bacterium]